MPWMLSSWISRAQRVRSCSRACIPKRNLLISTERSAARRCDTLDANACKASRSGFLKERSAVEGDHQTAALALEL